MSTSHKGALAGILVLAAVNFLWALGTPSYYVDEALSIEHALPALGDITEVVRRTETTPPTYFFALNQWLYHGGSPAEFDARLPQVVAGVLLVAAVFWTARAFAGVGVALLAALLCALSPFVLEYAQQVRVYAWVMLATTLAVGALARGDRWVVPGAVAAALAVLLHYTATFVIAPLLVWFAVRGVASARVKAAVIGVVVVCEAALVPLFVDQYRFAPEGGDLADASLTDTSLARVLGTPFDGRFTDGIDVWRVLGVLAVLAALCVAWRARRLLVVLAAAGPIALLLAAVAGKDILITRYAAAAAPFMVIAIAVAAARLPRRAGAALAAVALVAGVAGVVKSHQRTGYYGPAREVVEHIAADVRPTDTLLVPGRPGTDITLAFYGRRELDPLPRYLDASKPQDVEAAFDRSGRVWVIREAPEDADSDELLALAAPGLEAVGYRPLDVTTFSTSTTLVVVLATPA